MKCLSLAAVFSECFFRMEFQCYLSSFGKLRRLSMDCSYKYTNKKPSV